MGELSYEYLRRLRLLTETKALIWKRIHQDDATECTLENPSALEGIGVVIKRYQGERPASIEFTADFASMIITPEELTDDWSITFTPEGGRATTYTTDPSVLEGDIHLSDSYFPNSFRALDQAIWSQVASVDKTKITIDSVAARTKELITP